MYPQGELLQGRLRVSDYHPRDEATVTVSEERRGRQGRKVTVLGAANRNRAIHNDRVAVRLLQNSENGKLVCFSLQSNV